ncbi:MAG: DUF2752 domain-containing protein, partial [Planctomycetes bacterium]|nr:DUF2752 domain-containing protein [Planctomycetota bacterium]
GFIFMTDSIFKPLTDKAGTAQRAGALAIFVVCVAIAALLWSAGTGDTDIRRMVGICGFKQEYQLPCPGCGVTTSAIAFFQGHILESFHTQPAGGILCVALIAAGILSFMTAVMGVNFPFMHAPATWRLTKYIIVSLLIIFAAGWAVTMARAIVQK